MQNKPNWFTSNSFDNCPIIINKRLVLLISENNYVQSPILNWI